MEPMMATDAKANTLRLPGSTLYYETRGSGPVLLMIPGGPADAGAFDELAPLMADRYTVVAYDPRGNSRSVTDDPSLDQDMDLHADDAAALLATFGDQPADQPAYVLGSSGGAQIGLNLAVRHPGLVRTLVAHEPPCIALLPDADARRAAMEKVHAVYLRDGVQAAMLEFQTTIGMEGREPEPGQGPPSPERMAMFQRTMGNLEFYAAHGIRPISSFAPDVAALRAGAPKIVVGIGGSTAGQLAHTTAVALAEALGTEPVTFPGDHSGYGSRPEPFAALLHEVLRD
jgi:pimeloyl-ACP methyl ester carboxylesterase